MKYCDYRVGDLLLLTESDCCLQQRVRKRWVCELFYGPHKLKNKTREKSEVYA